MVTQASAVAAAAALVKGRRRSVFTENDLRRAARRSFLVRRQIELPLASVCLREGAHAGWAHGRTSHILMVAMVFSKAYRAVPDSCY